MFDDIEKDGYQLKNSLGCLRETLDWIDSQVGKYELNLDSEQNKYQKSLLHEFVNDFLK